MKNWVWMGCLVLACAASGCGGDDAGSGESPSGGSIATPRESIEYQVAVLKSGDLESFRACFTARLRTRITAEAMAKGAEELGTVTLSELLADVEEGTHQGKKTAKVIMENGRTLTTLILTDGNWLADTIWFR